MLILIKTGTCGLRHRSRHHLPTGRRGRHRSDGAHHARRDPPIERSTAMRMNMFWVPTERNLKKNRSAALKNELTAPG